MKESKIIIIILMLFSILLIPLWLLTDYYCSGIDVASIFTNLYCGIVVGIITSICQYYSARSKIINRIYCLYFDFYRTYYYSNNKPIIGHYSSSMLATKLCDLNPKISEQLDDYCGFFKKHDKTYKKLNPRIELSDNYKIKDYNKSILYLFNKNNYDKFFSPIIADIEKILNNINEKRFKKDKEEMTRLFDYILE